jgi:hypothetical protein
MPSLSRLPAGIVFHCMSWCTRVRLDPVSLVTVDSLRRLVTELAALLVVLVHMALLRILCLEIFSISSCCPHSQPAVSFPPGGWEHGQSAVIDGRGIRK